MFSFSVRYFRFCTFDAQVQCPALRDFPAVFSKVLLLLVLVAFFDIQNVLVPWAGFPGGEAAFGSGSLWLTRVRFLCTCLWVTLR